MAPLNQPFSRYSGLNSGLPPLATIPQLASEFGLSTWFLYELIRQGKLPPGVVVRFGPRTTRINRAKWAEFVAAGGLEQPR